MEKPDQHGRIVDRLTAELFPVRPLRSVRVQLALWLSFGLMFLAVVAALNPRADLLQQLAEEPFLLHLAALLMSAAGMAHLGLAAVVPGEEPSWTGIAVTGVLALTAMAFPLAIPVVASPWSADFLWRGVPCTAGTLAIAIVPWFILVRALGQGSPFAPGIAGSTTGAAALLLAAAVMRIDCPLEERFHVAVWHMMPIPVFTLASGIVLSSWLRRRGRLAGR